MDATGALADLTEISSQVGDAAVFTEDGSVLASTFPAEELAARLARTAVELLAAAAELLPHGERALTQLEVALAEGSVFVVCDEARGIVASVAPGAPSGLVLYDLRSCLRTLDDSADDAHETPRKQTTRKQTTADA